MAKWVRLGNWDFDLDEVIAIMHSTHGDSIDLCFRGGLRIELGQGDGAEFMHRYEGGFGFPAPEPDPGQGEQP